MDDMSCQVQEMFDSVAPTYDLMNHLLSANFDKQWRHRAASMVLDGNVSRVLDLCTGTADLALCLAAAARHDMLIVGLDFSRAMLTRARLKIQRTSLACPPRLIQADCLSLPFADNSFDLVTIAFGIRNLSDVGQGIREMVRVTRSGGKVLILEFSLPPRGVFRNLYSFYLTRALPRIGNWLTRTSAYNYLQQSIRSFPDPQRFRELLLASGLHNIRIIPRSHGIVYYFLGEVQ